MTSQYLNRFICFWVLLPLAMQLLATGIVSAQNSSKIEVVPQIGHGEGVTSVAFSPDGRNILSGSLDKTLKLWDVVTGKLVRTFVTGDLVHAVAFSPDGYTVLSPGLNNSFELWDVTTGKLIRTFKGHSSDVTSVAFSPDGRFVLSGSRDNTLRLWDAATGKPIHTFLGHMYSVNSVAFSPDGRFVLSSSLDNTIRLWDAATGKELRIFQGRHLRDVTQSVKSVAFSPDGRAVLSGSGDNTLNLWDVATGKPIHTFLGHMHSVDAVAFSPDGRTALSGSHDGTLKLWDVTVRNLVRTMEAHSNSRNDFVSSVAFSANGRTVVSGSGDGTVKLWDVATGKLLRIIEGNSDHVLSVAFSPDGRALLSGDLGGNIKLWDTSSSQLLRTFQGNSRGVRSIAFSPDGRRAISGNDNQTVKLWDVATGEPIRTIDGWLTPVDIVAFSPDGRVVLSANREKAIQLWQIATGRLLATMGVHSDALDCVVFSPDGHSILSAGGGTVLKLWDATTGVLLRTFAGHANSVNSVTFSPDGRNVLSGSQDQTLKLWDVATGKLVRTFAGHSRGVRWGAFSTDGSLVISTAWGGVTKLWETASGRLLQTLQVHSDDVDASALSPDGRTVVSGGRDGFLRYWSSSSGNELVRLSAAGANDWLSITPEGFFNSRGGAGNLIHIVQGLEVTQIGQIKQSLFNPDLVREKLAYDPDGEVQRAAAVINLQKVIESGPPPAVEITSHRAGSKSGKDLVTVAARISDRGKGIGRIEWRVNGVTASVMSAPAGPGLDYDVSQQLALDANENRIEVIAYEGRNLLASLPAQTTIVYDGPADATKPQFFVLAIGINKYVDQGNEHGRFKPLIGSVPDAKAFSTEMEKAGARVYENVHVTLALDEDATLSKLDEAIAKIAGEISARDTFVLYAAAHGYSPGGNYYMIPQDYQGGDNPEALKTRAVSQDRIQEWLAKRIKAKRAVILLDTCESGALTGGYAKSRTEGTVSEAAVGRLHEATGRPVITAAAPGKPAYENYKGHGVFTYALIEALHQGDTNNNGKIEVTELAAHVERRVPELFAELKQNGFVVKGLAVARGGGEDAQTAHFGSTGEDFSLVARLP